MIKVALFGANGKMGREVIKALSRERDLSLIGTIGRLFASNDEIKFCEDSDHKLKIQWLKPTAHQSVNDIDVVIDFSEPNASLYCLRFCAENSIRFVSGTTGFNEEHVREIIELSKRTPIFLSSNFSRGVAMISTLLEYITSKLGDETHISLEEIHHKDKLDAPSGTAIDLRNTVTKILDKHSIKKDVSISSKRLGQHVGFHRATFLFQGETITIGHEAKDRSVFSLGALAATRWIIDMPPGLYDMRDLIDRT